MSLRSPDDGTTSTGELTVIVDTPTPYFVIRPTSRRHTIGTSNTFIRYSSRDSHVPVRSRYERLSLSSISLWSDDSDATSACDSSAVAGSATTSTAISARKRCHKLVDTGTSSVKRRRLQFPVTIDIAEDIDAVISSKFVLGLRLHCTNGLRIGVQCPSMCGNRPPSIDVASSDSSDVTGSDRDDEPLVDFGHDDDEATVSSSSGVMYDRELDLEVFPVGLHPVNVAAEMMALPGKHRRRVRIPSDEIADHLGFLGYEVDTYEHRRSLETKYHPVHCLVGQPQMSAARRSLLVDWMTTLSDGELGLQSETLFLAVNVFDRFLATTLVAAECFQLLAVTAIFIGAKMEWQLLLLSIDDTHNCGHGCNTMPTAVHIIEVKFLQIGKSKKLEETYPPEIKQLLAVCVDVYTRNQLLNLEQMVLCRLQFNLMTPTSHYFLGYYCAERARRLRGVYSRQVFRRLRFVTLDVLRTTLRDYALCQYRPSLLAYCVMVSVIDAASCFASTTTDGGRIRPGGSEVGRGDCHLSSSTCSLEDGRCCHPTGSSGIPSRNRGDDFCRCQVDECSANVRWYVQATRVAPRR